MRADLDAHLRQAGLSPEMVDATRFENVIKEMRAAESREYRGDRRAFRQAARRAVAEGRQAVREAAAP